MIKINKLELNTKLGTFKFAENFNTTADIYQAMVMFEVNNWEMLGETSYTLHSEFETVTFTGINASAHLAAHLEVED